MNAKIPYTRKRFLREAEREGLEAIVKHDGEVRTETDKMYPGPNQSENDPRIKRVKKVLKEGELIEPDRSDKKNLEAREGQLKEWLQSRMVPRSHIGLRPSKDGVQSLDFRKTTASMAREELSPQFQEVAREWKNIMHLLGRGPEANIEEIRPETR